MATAPLNISSIENLFILTSQLVFIENDLHAKLRKHYYGANYSDIVNLESENINGLLDQFAPSAASLATKIYLGKDNVRLLPELSHWILKEEPELTATEIISFLRR